MLMGAIPCLALGLWVGSYLSSESQEAGEGEAVYRGKSIRFWLLQLEDYDPHYRQAAVQALGPSVVSTLGRMLQDRDPLVRVDAAIALRRFGAEAQPALAALLAALDDENLLVRCNVVPALGGMDTQDPAIMAALTKAIKDPCAAVRLIAVKTVGEIGPGAKDAVPVIREALADSDRDVRQLAAEALRKIDRVQE
jgi:HEAT repeat protein